MEADAQESQCMVHLVTPATVALGFTPNLRLPAVAVAATLVLAHPTN
jgi:hypothetical protein